MGLYINQLPHLPLPTDYSKSLGELSSSEPLELLDPKSGLLRYEGWSKFPNKWLYNPEMNKAYTPLFNRQKHWNYFYFISDSYLVTMAHTDLGLVKAAYINIKDIKDLSKPMIQVKIEDFFGNYINIDTEKNGPGIQSTVAHENLNMTFSRRPEEFKTNIKVSGHSESGPIEGSFTANSKGYEGISYISSVPNDPYKHSFKYKLQQKFIGNLKLNGKTIISCTEKKPCLGLHDNARGVYSYAGGWFWGSTSFKTRDHEIALNFEFSEDNPHSSWDSVFIDGKLYKLDPLVLHKVNKDHWKWNKAPEANHHSTSIQLEFKRVHEHSIGANYLVYNIDLNSNFGYFSGIIKTEDGQTIKFDDVFGFIEDFNARW